MDELEERKGAHRVARNQIDHRRWPLAQSALAGMRKQSCPSTVCVHRLRSLRLEFNAGSGYTTNVALAEPPAGLSRRSRVKADRRVLQRPDSDHQLT